MADFVGDEGEGVKGSVSPAPETHERRKISFSSEVGGGGGGSEADGGLKTPGSSRSGGGGGGDASPMLSPLSEFGEEVDGSHPELMRCASDESTMSLAGIIEELGALMEKANAGLPFDERRLDELIKAQEENPEYQAQLQAEHDAWRASVDSFLVESLLITRTFVPLHIFTSDHEALLVDGLSAELSKRILKKQCLWLVRMSTEEIARLHEADLTGRFNPTGEMLDVVEMAAIYCSLPDRFCNDRLGKKIAWRDQIETVLRKMLNEREKNVLPKGKVRAPAYGDLERGPISNVYSTREVEVVSSEGSQGPRRSFQEVCRRHSINRKRASTTSTALYNPDADPDA